VVGFAQPLFRDPDAADISADTILPVPQKDGEYNKLEVCALDTIFRAAGKSFADGSSSSLGARDA
jgi:hypothetical protein